MTSAVVLWLAVLAACGTVALLCWRDICEQRRRIRERQEAQRRRDRLRDAQRRVR